MKEIKQKRGRPIKQKIFSAKELQIKAQDGLKLSQERRLCLDTLDVEEFCDSVMKVTGKHKFTRKELDEMREKVDCLYRKYLDEKWEEEAQQTDPFIHSLRAIANGSDEEVAKGMMNRAEWNEAHGLRYDGSKKRGPTPKPKKKVWELSPGEFGLAEEKHEGVDLEAMEKLLEDKLMDEYVKQQKEEEKFLKGKRTRRDTAPQRPTKPKPNFWI